jgi:putative nucleotidyltransferase-like protein
MPGGREPLGSTERWPLPREAQLLLATAGGPEQDPRIIALAAGPVDWILLLQLSALERAEAVLAGRLSRLGVELPAEPARQLQAMGLRSDLRMTTISHRLDRTLTALEAAGVQAMLLKGAALGRTLYGSLARRPMLDLDLLIRPEDAATARRTAIEMGWADSEVNRANDQYAGHFHLPPLTDGLGFGFNLELHTGLFVEGHPFDWPLNELWSRSRRLEGGLGRVPAPEDLLLHIALHFAWSHMARVGPWRAFRDIHTLATSGTVDWRAFVRLAAASNGGPAVYWTFRLARQFGVSGVPADVEAELSPRLNQRVARALDRHLAGQWYLLDAPCPSVRLERALWKLAMGPLGRVQGHAMPWARELVFPDLWSSDPVVSRPGRLLRHLSNVGSYARYFRRVVLGSPARRAAAPATS